MRYLEPSFSTFAVGSESFRDNWDAIFKKKEETSGVQSVSERDNSPSAGGSDLSSAGDFPEVAQLGYEAYCKTLRVNRPAWEHLPVDARIAWVTAAVVIRQHAVKEHAEAVSLYDEAVHVNQQLHEKVWELEEKLWNLEINPRPEPEYTTVPVGKKTWPYKVAAEYGPPSGVQSVSPGDELSKEETAIALRFADRVSNAEKKATLNVYEYESELSIAALSAEVPVEDPKEAPEEGGLEAFHFRVQSTLDKVRAEQRTTMEVAARIMYAAQRIEEQCGVRPTHAIVNPVDCIGSLYDVDTGVTTTADDIDVQTSRFCPRGSVMLSFKL